jgi:hypothetical protein
MWRLSWRGWQQERGSCFLRGAGAPLRRLLPGGGVGRLELLHNKILYDIIIPIKIWEIFVAKGWTLSYYFIAFIDVLGQSKELLKLNRLPTTPEEKAKASVILHNTAGNIVDLREGFRKFFRARNRSTGILDSLTPDKREIAERARRAEALITSISDAVIIAVPLSNENDHCLSMSSIYSALYAICGLFITSLAIGKPFRSGIDTGIGVPISKNEVYGGALVKAYKLEKSSAKYPRIVVGDSLIEYINTVQKQNSNTDYAKLAKKWAGDSKLYIIDDKDKTKMLDVIGEGVKSISGGVDSKLVETAYRFIVQSQKEFKNSGEIELYFRYGYLRDYFESKLSLWNIQPIE